MNPYLKRKREEYEALRSTVDGIQTRAAEADRDLTEDELRSVTDQAEQMKTLYGEIESLTEVEERTRKVGELAAKVRPDQLGDPANPPADANLGGQAHTRDRDPGHYTRGSQHSFFSDIYASRALQDDDATRRLAEHNRALSTGVQGTGVVPPKWLTDEYEELPYQGRAIASAVRNVPLGDDPRPLTLPKQTDGTSVSEQDAENDAVAESDSYSTDVDTVTPRPVVGKQTVSRQMIEMSSPAIDQLIYGDLLANYNAKVESNVATAIMAVGTALSASETGTGADVPVDDPTHYLNVELDAEVAVLDARKMPANLAIMSTARMGKFLKLKDTTGRPLIPNPGTGQAVNVAGVGSVAVSGIVNGVGMVATSGVTDSQKFAVLHAPDTLLFESNMTRFRFEEQAGPESVILGIWRYAAVLVRQGTRSVKRVSVTATTA